MFVRILPIPRSWEKSSSSGWLHPIFVEFRNALYSGKRMMEAAGTSETLVNFYQTTWRYNPEGSHLQHSPP
jgi:hypothetical protein